MNTLRVIFSEVVRLVRVCWEIWFAATPFTFREGDISRSFTERINLLSGTGKTLVHKVITSDRLYLHSIAFMHALTLTPPAAPFYLSILVNGQEVYTLEPNTFVACNVNLILGPGEITFYLYQASGSAQDVYVVVESWERNEDDAKLRLLNLLPGSDPE